MSKDLSELIFVLDKSGSMAGLESDTIGGYNSTLKKQWELPGECRVTTILFDTKIQFLRENDDLKTTPMMTEREYQANGGTALLDAVGTAIDVVGHRIKYASESLRPEHVVVVIITDGRENSSCRYSLEQVRYMIEHQRRKFNWDFVFLGANIDAIAEAAKFGVDSSRASNFCHDTVGVELNFQAVNCLFDSIRRGNKTGMEWKKRLEEDYQQRGRKNK